MSQEPAHHARYAYLRLVVACVLSLTALPWLSGKAFISLQVGHLLWVEATGWTLCTLCVLAAVFHLGHDPRIWRLRWPLAIGLPVGWMAIKAIAAALNLSPLSPWQTVLLVTTATLYTLWIPWMFLRRWGWPLRAGVLLLLLASSAPYWALLQFEGLTGELGLHYAWRQWQAAPQIENLPGQPEPSADVTPVVIDPARDYPQFLGPGRNGVLSDTKMSPKWNQTPPQLNWRRRVGAAWSSVAIADGRLWTMEQREDQEVVACYRLNDGKPLWAYGYNARYDSPMGGAGPRSTPTIYQNRVYTTGATGQVHCLNAATGELVWQADMLQGRTSMYHGESNSPLIVPGETADLLIVAPTGEGGPSLIAYDAATGEVKWQTEEDRASYSSPRLVTLAGRPQILLLACQHLLSIDPQSGDVLWRYAWSNRVETSVAQPLVHTGGQDRVFISCGYGQGAAMLQVKQSATGELSVESLWTSKAMKNKFCGSVPLDGYIYGMDDGILACINAANGRKQWKKGRFGHGQILLAGKHLIVQCEDGDVALLKPTPKGPGELARIEALDGKTWNHPALAGSTLVVRNATEMACYELPTP